MASLLRTLTFTTASVAAAASSSTNQTIVSNIADIVKIKVVPSNVNAGELTSVFIYKNNTFSAADLVYSTTSFSGNLVDPIETDGITNTERNEGFVAMYEDTDNANQLHIKIVNSGTVSRTFAVTITYRVEAVDLVDVHTYGVKGDGVLVQDAVMVATSATLTSVSGAFTALDVGKAVVVIGAGASSATLTGTITALISSTQVTLSATASTSVTGALAIWATDDTAALAVAVTESDCLYFPAGVYGATTIRIRQGQKVIGEGINNAQICRLGTGSGGAFLGMLSGQTAEHLHLEDFSLFCNSISTLNGLELGTEIPGTTEFASSSILNNIRVFSASGEGVYLRSNTGQVKNLWIQNSPTSGTPTGLSLATSRGLRVTGSTFSGFNIHVEGRFENGDMSIEAGISNLRGLHFECAGVYTTKDILSIAATAVHVEDMLVLVSAAVAASRRDFIRISAGSEYFKLRGLTIDQSGATLTSSSTYALNDLNQSQTIAWTEPYIVKYDSLDTSNNLVERSYPKQQFIGNITKIRNVATNFPSSQGAADTVLANDGSGNLSWMIIKAGVYTPTITSGGNVAATTAYEAQYMRIGATVLVSGFLDVDPTAAGGTSTLVGISLPVASNFGAESDCGGTAVCNAAVQAGAIYANVANDRADMVFNAISAANLRMSYVFAYQVI